MKAVNTLARRFLILATLVSLSACKWSSIKGSRGGDSGGDSLGGIIGNGLMMYSNGEFNSRFWYHESLALVENAGTEATVVNVTGQNAQNWTKVSFTGISSDTRLDFSTIALNAEELFDNFDAGRPASNWRHRNINDFRGAILAAEDGSYVRKYYLIEAVVPQYNEESGRTRDAYALVTIELRFNPADEEGLEMARVADTFGSLCGPQVRDAYVGAPQLQPKSLRNYGF